MKKNKLAVLSYLIKLGLQKFMDSKKSIFLLMVILMLLLTSPTINADFSIILNFDDGYDGVFTNAFPIMQKYDIPGVVFVITKQLDRNKYLSIEQLKVLKDSGWEIGSHTICHYDLTKIISSDLKHEIRGSKKQLKDLGLIGDSYASFASPNTKWSPKIEKLVSETYQVAREKELHILKDNKMFIEKTIHRTVVKSTDLEQLRYWIYEAKLNDQPLILIFHEVAEGGNQYFYSPDNFKKLIKLINNYKITTFKEYYSLSH